MQGKPHTHPFGLSLSKAYPLMVRQAHHKRNEDIRCLHYLGKSQQFFPPGAPGRVTLLADAARNAGSSSELAFLS